MVTHLTIKELLKQMIQISKTISYNGEFFLSSFSYKRFPTRKVRIGNLYIGGDEPIRIQSMTTTSTMDIQSTFLQAKELFDVGCEIVRITTRNTKEAKALGEIKNLLLQNGYNGPIVADVHFSPEVALIVADYADKVRINPGNFADSKKFEKKEYTDLEYEQELERVHEELKPLILKLKEKGKSLRIGANHGSLSDRIMNRFGDTPEGMVESAIELIKIAEYYDFKDIVVSMKASNPYIMIIAYKMLIERFIKEKMNYPIHLGVTEAGDGKDGRIKSASGIGLLLLEGIGDTIRVSLTEDPVEEIPVAKKILEYVEKIKKENQSFYSYLEKYDQKINFPYELKRTTIDRNDIKIGSSYSLKWITTFDFHSLQYQNFYKNFIKNLPDFWVIHKYQIEDYKNIIHKYPILQNISPIVQIDNINDFINTYNYKNLWIDLNIDQELRINEFKDFSIVILNFVFDSIKEINLDKFINILEEIKKYSNILFSFKVNNSEIDLIRLYRFLNAKCKELPPFVLQISVDSSDQEIIKTAILGAGGIYSNIGDLFFIKTNSLKESYELGSDILQNTRIRLSRADFISCPSCGRTLFDLQTTTQKIKELTQHLSGIKIGIMGCIVNGLGEMADADFGYVGASPGKVNLYKGKELIKRNVPEELAPEELVKLIKESGMWKDKESGN